MRLKLTIITLFVFPVAVFSQSIRLDTRTQLTGFLKLSQNDFAIDSKSAVASESAAYIANKAADANADGSITYAEYLEYLNKISPYSITAFNLAISKLLPYLKDFSFSATGGTVGSGVLTEDYRAGSITLPAGAKITIAQDALLVNYDGVLSDGTYTTPNLSVYTAVIRFDDETIPRSVIPSSVRTPEILSELFINPKEENLILKPNYEKIAPKILRGVRDGEPFLEHIVQRKILPMGFSLLHGVLQSDASIKNAQKLVGVKDIVRMVLDETFSWFRANPPAYDGSNLEDRRAHSAILDQLGFEFPSLLSNQAWWPFSNSAFYNKAGYESEYLILYYLHKAEQTVLDEVKRTIVTNGVRIWKLYNMGIIVKTPDKCFAIDLNPFFVSFASVLDFAITSHEHHDHGLKLDARPLMEAKKPIFVAPDSRGSKGGTPPIIVIRENKTITIGNLTITFVLSMQKLDWADVPCLITIVDCGPATGNFIVMHIGDANKPEEYPQGLNVDYLEYHGEGGYEEATSIIQPRLINIGHLLELDHNGLWGNGIDGKGGYTGAYKVLPNNGMLTAETTATVLTWGESILFTN